MFGVNDEISKQSVVYTISPQICTIIIQTVIIITIASAIKLIL